MWQNVHSGTNNYGARGLQAADALSVSSVFIEGASVAPRTAPRAEVDVSLTGVLHKLFRQGRSGLTG